MNTLNELCAIAERSGSASFPLRQAWEAVMPEAAASRPAKKGRGV